MPTNNPTPNESEAERLLALDLYTLAAHEANRLPEPTETKQQFAQAVDEWDAIAKSLRPTRYEGPNN